MNTPKNFIILVPIFGVLFFVILYVFATFFYPGGCNSDSTTKGFLWLSNYWCDLTGTLAKNGEMNAARPIALFAMLMLCCTLMIFWFYLPLLFHDLKTDKILIRYCGIASMIIAIFLFTSFHDIVINIAGALGVMALTKTFIGLFKNKRYGLFALGVFSLTEMLFNFIIYKASLLIPFQPIIQKMTFVFFFLWISLVDFHLYRTLTLKLDKEQ